MYLQSGGGAACPKGHVGSEKIIPLVWNECQGGGQHGHVQHADAKRARHGSYAGGPATAHSAYGHPAGQVKNMHGFYMNRDPLESGLSGHSELLDVLHRLHVALASRAGATWRVPAAGAGGGSAARRGPGRPWRAGWWRLPRRPGHQPRRPHGRPHRLRRQPGNRPARVCGTGSRADGRRPWLRPAAGLRRCAFLYPHTHRYIVPVAGACEALKGLCGCIIAGHTVMGSL